MSNFVEGAHAIWDRSYNYLAPNEARYIIVSVVGPSPDNPETIMVKIPAIFGDNPLSIRRDRLRPLTNRNIINLGEKLLNATSSNAYNHSPFWDTRRIRRGGAREQVLPGQLFFRGDRVKLNPNQFERFLKDWRGTIVDAAYHERLQEIYYNVNWDQPPYPQYLPNPSVAYQRVLVHAENNNMNGGRRSRRNRKSRRNTKRRR